MFRRPRVNNARPWPHNASCNACEIYPRSPKSWPKSPVVRWGHGSAVVDMAWRELKREELPFVIDDERQFEAIEPAQRRLAPGRPALEDLVGSNPAVMTHRPLGSSR